MNLPKNKEEIKVAVNQMGEAGLLDDKFWPNPSAGFYYAFRKAIEYAATLTPTKNPLFEAVSVEVNLPDSPGLYLVIYENNYEGAEWFAEWFENDKGVVSKWLRPYTPPIVEQEPVNNSHSYALPDGGHATFTAEPNKETWEAIEKMVALAKESTVAPTNYYDDLRKFIISETWRIVGDLPPFIAGGLADSIINRLASRHPPTVQKEESDLMKIKYVSEMAKKDMENKRLLGIITDLKEAMIRGNELAMGLKFEDEKEDGDAVAFAEWMITNGYRHYLSDHPDGKRWAQYCDSTRFPFYTTAELYQLFINKQ